MNKYEYVVPTSLSKDSSIYELFSSQENSMLSSFVSDELDAVPTEEEKKYFMSLQKTDPMFSKIIGDDEEEEEMENKKTGTPELNSQCIGKSDSDEQDKDQPYETDSKEKVDKKPAFKATVSSKLFDIQAPPFVHNEFFGNPFKRPQSNPSHFNGPEQLDIPLQEPYQNKWRTQPCLFYQRYGFCRKGDECNFQHIPSTGKQFISVDQLYRTKPCKYFFTTGTCRKGDNCNYSHDVSVCYLFTYGHFAIRTEFIRVEELRKLTTRNLATTNSMIDWIIAIFVFCGRDLCE
ncbi:hypothetical protein EIN_082550 [Entamoeba invadens IP1]|uniref:hypothetical protein n=1 Tax=Entamoeba invadens IP1 TaxID=370355 RepID=UPI0002C3ED16|nr:hypothetical protein EIN_082550 [Entamoeba invadens IP1]ELP85173.1 hypothetical protein EIN_082550 [Entamoeba invadens IP1]|eukprot:XP_004184519.1 hypothetical protein EIN_082550 [Entamoeba invadens IP1]